MKYCSRPFDYLYLDDFNGNVCLCPWIDPQDGVVGNIVDQSFEEIWYGKKAEELRDTIRRGTFDYCRTVACPYIQNEDLEDRLVEDYEYVARKNPKTVNLAFDFICNQSCPTCRCEVFIPDSDYRLKVDTIVDKMLPVIEKANMLTASGHGDPFASPYMMKILENLHPEDSDYHILLETNGVFLDESHWKRIEHLANYNLEIVETTNSYYEPIYNQLSRGGNLEKLKQNQLFLKELRNEGKIRRTTNCMVVQEKNYIEIPEFIKKSIDVYGFDKVVLKPIYNWGNLTEEEYWFKDVLNPLHPYNEEYRKIIELPIVKNNNKVFNFGGESMHKCTPMPGNGSFENNRNRKQAEFLKKWIINNDVNETVKNNINNYNSSSIFIYGAAEIGRVIARTLIKLGFEVEGFIDQYCQNEKIDDINVYKIGDSKICSASIVIISTIHIFDEVSDVIINKYDTKCISAEDLIL